MLQAFSSMPDDEWVTGTVKNIVKFGAFVEVWPATLFGPYTPLCTSLCFPVPLGIYILIPLYHALVNPHR